MIAPRSTTHVADTLALLTTAYKGKPVIQAILTSLANRTQEAENAIWAIADAVSLSGTPVGVWLDALGEIAGEPRLNRLDAEYLIAVRARLRANRSQGNTVDVLEVMALVGLAFQYYETPDDPGCFRVDAYSVLYPDTVRRLLALTRAAGTRAVFGYTPLARAPVIGGGGSVVAATLIWNETTWGDSAGATNATSWGSAQEAVIT